jgi:hypothetical protein
MNSNQPDYLKYWRVIRYFIKAKYGLTQSDLDILLFLNSESYFSRSKFEEFDELLGWDKTRFAKLVREGWIDTFRRRTPGRRALYKLSYKTERVIKSIYDKLSGQEIPMSPSANPMFAKNVKYTDKVYRNMIKDMNKTTRRQQHLAHESQ